ncbi:MAG: HEAT repeat domain-containing protein, partial [Polyangiales bacterium]
LGDAAGQVRVAAIEALAQLPSAQSLALLSELAGADEPDMRRASLIGLGLMQNAESLPVLIAACSAAEPATRLVALSAVQAFPSPQTLGLIANALQDPDEAVRGAALGLLASSPHAEATRLLIAAMHDDAARDHIARALATPVQGRIAGVLQGLETADDELAPRLLSVLGQVDPGDRTGALFAALQLPNAAARKAAASMLGARGTRDALDALARQAVDDSSDEVRRICLLLLTQ